MSDTPNNWLAPNFLLSAVLAIGALGSFWVNFDRRVSGAETKSENVEMSLKEHKQEEADKLARIEDKIDRLIERSAK